jgi:hypothetical protein
MWEAESIELLGTKPIKIDPDEQWMVDADEPVPVFPSDHFGLFAKFKLAPSSNAKSHT